MVTYYNYFKVSAPPTTNIWRPTTVALVLVKYEIHKNNTFFLRRMITKVRTEQIKPR